MNHPFLLLLLTVASTFILKEWWRDLRAGSAGRPFRHALPGAAPSSRRAIGIAIFGALGLLAIETAGEMALGVAAEQSRMTWLFAAYSIAAAPVIEEIIFRGWLVIESRGAAAMWAGAVGASLVFALLHPFLWRWNDDGFAITLTPKGWFSSTIVFATSLWLYAARLATWNPQRSLLPCFAAHAAKNAGVVVVKTVTGYMAGLW